MLRIGAWPHSIALVAIVAALAGCNAAPPASSPAPGSTSTPGVSLPAADETSILAAAQAEFGLRQALLKDIGAEALIGPAGRSVLADIQASETEFGEAALAEVVEQFDIDVNAAGLRRPIAVLGDWSGSLLGNTSFMVSTWMGFAPLLLENLGADKQFRQQTQNHSKDYDKVVDGVREQLQLRENMTVGAGQGRVVFDVTITATSVLSDAGSGAQIARMVSTSLGHFELNACPDAQGIGEGKYKLVNQEEVSGGAVAGNGGASSTESTFRVVDGDDAHLIQTDAQVSTTAGAHGSSVSGEGAAGAPFDWGAGATFGVTIPAHGSTGVSSVSGESAHDATPQNRSALDTMLFMATHYLSEAAKEAEKFWRSGQCIELTTTEESRDVDPNEELSVEVESKGAFDGQPIDKPITGNFAGVQSMDPGSGTALDPPATFDYKAGPNPDDTGTISLEQISKRGIGKKTLTFKVKQQDFLFSAEGTSQWGVPGLAEFKGHFVVTDVPLHHDANGIFRGTGEILITDPQVLSGNCSVNVNVPVPIEISATPDEGDSSLIRVTIPIPLEAGQTTETCEHITVPVPLAAVVGPWVAMISTRGPYPLDTPTSVNASSPAGTNEATVTIKPKPQ